MRIANVDGRAVLLTPDASGVDVAMASAGKFGPPLPAVYDGWDSFRAWAEEQTDLPVDVHFRRDQLDSPCARAEAGLRHRAQLLAHAAESGFEPHRTLPPTFTKFRRRLAGPDDDVVLPRGGNIDWEVELVAVIGTRADRRRRGRRLGARRRTDGGPGHLRARLAARGRHRSSASASPSRASARSGPWLVTPDEFADPDDLELGCSVNGETVQKGRTRDLIFPVPRLVAELSRDAAAAARRHRSSPARRPASGVGRTPPALPAARRDARSAGSRASASSRQTFVDEPGAGRCHEHCTESDAASTHGRPQRRRDRRLLRRVRPRPTSAAASFRTRDGGEQLRIVSTRRPAGWSSSASASTTADDLAQRSRPGWPGSASRSEPGRPCTPRPRAGLRLRRPRRGRAADQPGARRGNALQRTRPHRPHGAARPASSARPRSGPQKLGHVVIGSTDLRDHDGLLHRGPRLQGQRPRRGQGRVHALLDRPPQRARPGRAGEVPAPHSLAGRRHRRDRPRRHADARGQPRAARLGPRAATTSARTSSGTSGIRPATSPSTTPTWTASPTTSSGPPRCWEGAAGPVQLGAAAAAVVPRPRGPRRADDRAALTDPCGSSLKPRRCLLNRTSADETPDERMVWRKSADPGVPSAKVPLYLVGWTQVERGDVGGEEVDAVAVEVASHTVVVLGGAWVGVPGQDRGVPQRHTGIECVRDRSVAQRVRTDMPRESLPRTCRSGRSTEAPDRGDTRKGDPRPGHRRGATQTGALTCSSGSDGSLPRSLLRRRLCPAADRGWSAQQRHRHPPVGVPPAADRDAVRQQVLRQGDAEQAAVAQVVDVGPGHLRHQRDAPDRVLVGPLL